MTDETVQILSIGSVVGGPTPQNRPWRDAVRDLTTAVIAARAGRASSLNLNVVFQISGNLLAPDFEGVRTGRYSKAERLLMVQVALPGEVPDNPAEYLRSALRMAVAEAEAWSTKRRVSPDFEQVRLVVDGL